MAKKFIYILGTYETKCSNLKGCYFINTVHADRYLRVAADKGVGAGYSKPMKQAYQRAQHIAFQLWTRRFEIEIRLNPTFVLC